MAFSTTDPKAPNNLRTIALNPQHDRAAVPAQQPCWNGPPVNSRPAFLPIPIPKPPHNSNKPSIPNPQSLNHTAPHFPMIYLPQPPSMTVKTLYKLHRTKTPRRRASPPQPGAERSRGPGTRRLHRDRTATLVGQVIGKYAGFACVWECVCDGRAG